MLNRERTESAFQSQNGRVSRLTHGYCRFRLPDLPVHPELIKHNALEYPYLVRWFFPMPIEFGDFPPMFDCKRLDPSSTKWLWSFSVSVFIFWGLGSTPQDDCALTQHSYRQQKHKQFRNARALPARVRSGTYITRAPSFGLRDLSFWLAMVSIPNCPHFKLCIAEFRNI